MKKRGFTLLELILVILMTTILIGAMGFVYFTCCSAWNVGKDRSELRTQVSQSLEWITRNLYPAQNVVLESPQSLKFTKGSSDYRLYLYSLDDPGVKYDQNSYSLLQSDASEAYGAGIVLATGVQPNIFSYVNNIVAVDLTATQNNITVHERTKIKPRNL